MSIESASLRDVTISAAEVTIRVVNVADKAMTIAVYEQLPMHTLRGGERCVGFINRCPRLCRVHGTAHRHVLAVIDGEPVLLDVVLEASFQETKLRGMCSGRIPIRDPGMTTEYAQQLADELRDIRQTFARDVLPALPQLYVAR